MIEVSSLLSLTAVAIKLQLEIILPLALFFFIKSFFLILVTFRCGQHFLKPKWNIKMERLEFWLRFWSFSFRIWKNQVFLFFVSRLTWSSNCFNLKFQINCVLKKLLFSLSLSFSVGLSSILSLSLPVPLSHPLSPTEGQWLPFQGQDVGLFWCAAESTIKKQSYVWKGWAWKCFRIKMNIQDELGNEIDKFFLGNPSTGLTLINSDQIVFFSIHQKIAQIYFLPQLQRFRPLGYCSPNDQLMFIYYSKKRTQQ